MNERDRYLLAVKYQPVDRLPLWHAYGLMPGVLDSWHEEGLPASVQTDADIREFFGFAWKPASLPLNLGPIPGYETKIIEDTDEHRIEMDLWGRKTKLLKAVTTLPLAMEFPVSDWDTWREMKPRLELSTERIGADYEDIVASNIGNGQINQFGSRGFYWFPRDLMGDMNLSIAYYEQPDLVHDINETWCTLIEYVLNHALERRTIDTIHFAEDMAYRNASMIGPETFNEFIRPYYQRIRAIVEKYDVPVFSVDTDGCMNELIHWFADCGVNLTGPNEVQAKNDVVAYQNTFGTSMAYFGGLDKRELVKGREAIDAMLDQTIPTMMAGGGGWIMSLDHRVIPGTDFSDFTYFLERARTLSTF